MRPKQDAQQKDLEEIKTSNSGTVTGNGKVLLGRLDPKLSREEAIEQASEQMFIHLTGRKPPLKK
jgi:hypothetical protein